MTARYQQSSRAQVLEAVIALSEQEMEVTAESIQRQTGLKMVTIADCLKELKERDEIWSVERGVYRPRDKEEASQPIYLTSRPGGGMTIEKGEQIIQFTAYEWRQQVAPAAAGYCAQTVVIEHTHQTMRLAEMVSKLRRQVEALKDKMAEDGRQIELEV